MKKLVDWLLFEPHCGGRLLVLVFIGLSLYATYRFTQAKDAAFYWQGEAVTNFHYDR